MHLESFSSVALNQPRPGWGGLLGHSYSKLSPIDCRIVSAFIFNESHVLGKVHKLHFKLLTFLIYVASRWPICIIFVICLSATLAKW